MTTHQHIIDRGPFKGMVETLTDNPHPAKTARCYMCAEPLKASTSWMSLVGDHQDGVFIARFLCPLCAKERLNGIPDEAERCWNYTQAAQSDTRIAKILLHLSIWCGVLTTGGAFLFAIFLLLKNLF